jgi:hypothetical protein
MPSPVRELPATVEQPPLEPAFAMSRPEFETAIRSMLRSWHQPDAVAANPLVSARVFGADDPVVALRKTVRIAVDRLRDDRQGDKPCRAVVATYFDRAWTTQQAAARRIGVPFSSYRRHLNRGLDRLCELLWHQYVRDGDNADL